jgi:hypothetical protein
LTLNADTGTQLMSSSGGTAPHPAEMSNRFGSVLYGLPTICPGTMAMPPLKAFHFKCIIGCEASSRASDREVVEPVHGTDPIMVSIGTK